MAEQTTLLPREPKYTPTSAHRDIGMRRIDQIRRAHGFERNKPKAPAEACF